MDLEKAERLYLKYSKAMLRAAIRSTDDYHLAEDAVHQAFEKAMKMLSTINESNEKRTGGLLILMTTQSVTELYHKKVRDIGNPVCEEEIRPASTATDDILDKLLQRDTLHRVSEAIAQLPAIYAEPVTLKYVYGMSSEKIAQTLGVELNTVNVRIFRARQKVKKYLLKGGESE